MLLEDISEKYFPVPAGTNTKMSAFNIEVLIRLKHKSKLYERSRNKKLISKADKVTFYSKNEAYTIMKDTIIGINREIYRNDLVRINRPYYTEMLLFGIADTLIYDQIVERVQVMIE